MNEIKILYEWKKKHSFFQVLDLTGIEPVHGSNRSLKTMFNPLRRRASMKKKTCPYCGSDIKKNE